jgi:uncharacterized protein YdhG (YjbR/CyaY superfamily)
MDRGESKQKSCRAWKAMVGKELVLSFNTGKFKNARRRPESINMTMEQKKPRPQTISEYINAAPKDARKKLREMRAAIRASAPGAKESLKWGMPAFSHRRILVTFAAFQHHIGFYPTPSAVKVFAKDLAKFATAKGSIQFPLDKPLPLSLIRKITAFRVRETIEQDKKWRT